MSTALLHDVLYHDPDLRQMIDVLRQEWKLANAWSDWDEKVYQNHMALIMRIHEHMDSAKKLRVGFDLHGVLEKYPDQFKPIIQQLRKEGIEIWIISGPPLMKIRGDLEKLGYTPFSDYFDRFESVVDFLSHDPSINFWQDEKGNWWVDEPIWWATKGRICEANNIDILVDDSIRYHENFSCTCKTEFILIKDADSLSVLPQRICLKKEK